jgi:hypothetical protein
MLKAIFKTLRFIILILAGHKQIALDALQFSGRTPLRDHHAIKKNKCVLAGACTTLESGEIRAKTSTGFACAFIPRHLLGVTRHRVQHIGVPRFLKFLERLTAHCSVDVRV